MDKKALLLLPFVSLVVLVAAYSVGTVVLTGKLPDLFGTKPEPSPQVINTSPNHTGPSPDFKLTVPQGFQIGVYAKNLGSARDLEFSPGGTLLVSVPESGKVLALPDRNGDGIADSTVEVITGLNKPHGLAFYQNQLFIAEETRVVRYNWDENSFTATPDKELFGLPLGGRHTTRTLAFNQTGQLFVSIGSTCDVCIENDPWLASIIVSNANGDTPQIFAKGLRNSVFITVNPATNQLWGADMGRDNLGDDVPPDEINIIQSNRNYGWPYCWGKKVHDTQFDTNVYIADPCANTEPPQYGIQAHSAPLGLTFIKSAQFPPDWQGDLLVAYHGSWNRSVPVGYKIVHLKLSGNDVVSEENFLTGFINGVTVSGRPVDVLFDLHGSLYISDDKAGAVYKIIHL
jgi:glucose/arabinose dehydrogenase